MKYSVLIRLLCLSLLFTAGCVQQGANTDGALLDQTSTPSAAGTKFAEEERSERPSADDMHLTTSNTIREVVNHQAFEGFGHFILPLDRGRYDNNMPLEKVGHGFGLGSGTNAEGWLEDAVQFWDDHMIDRSSENENG